MLRSYLESKSKDSITRLVFLSFSFFVLVWETIVIIKGTTVPNMIEILGFMAVSMGWKQYTETKGDR